jgi:hypothetical protein
MVKCEEEFYEAARPPGNYSFGLSNIIKGGDDEAAEYSDRKTAVGRIRAAHCHPYHPVRSRLQKHGPDRPQGGRDNQPHFTKTTLANTVLINFNSSSWSFGSAVYTKDKAHFQVVAEKRKIYSAALIPGEDGNGPGGEGSL